MHTSALHATDSSRSPLVTVGEVLRIFQVMSLPRLDFDPRKERGQDEPPIEWVAALGCWCVFEPKAVTEVLRSGDFISADFAKLHRQLEEKTDTDCSAAVGVLNHVPSANEGERHAECRRELARVLTANSASSREITANRVRDLVPKLCRPGARVDLVQEIILPVWDTLSECLLGVAPPSQPDNRMSASQVFDLYLGLNRRRAINTQMRDMLDAFSASETNLKTSPHYAAALSVLGHDSIVSALGCSLFRVLSDQEGQPLTAIAFPQTVPATGVPYIERFAAKDCSVASTPIRKADRVRLYLDAGKSTPDALDQLYFGRGRHSCLGEEISSWLWRTLANEFAALPLTCSIERVEMRKPDWVFVYYSSIEARFDV